MFLSKKKPKKKKQKQKKNKQTHNTYNPRLLGNVIYISFSLMV